MAPKVDYVRHGLYIPNDLLDQIRIMADRENRSINKQLEHILKQWLVLLNKRNDKKISRKDFLKLPINRRKAILEKQANDISAHYENNSEWQDLQGEDLIEY